MDGVYNAARTFLANLESFDGGDTATSRIQSVSSAGFSAMVQEEQSLDQEVAHPTESLSFIALSGTAGSLQALV